MKLETCGRLVLVVLVAITTANWAYGQRPPIEDRRELIVLLKAGPDRPDPQEVVQAINAGTPAQVLPEGNPIYAELLAERATGRLLQFIAQNPNSPEARLQYYILIGFQPQVNLEAIALALENNPNVAHTEVNRRFRYHAASAKTPTKATIPSDTFVGTGLSNPDEGQWALFLLRITDAWDWNTGIGYLGVLDVGLDIDHEEFVPFGTNAETGQLMTGPFRSHLSEDIAYGGCVVDTREEVNQNAKGASHGSHVSGLLAARGFNGKGVIGVCVDCALEVVRMEAGSVPHVVRGLDKVIRNGVQGVNMSFGWVEDPCAPGVPTAICDELQVAANRDILLVASTGNDLLPVEFPANDIKVIGVGGLEWAGVDTTNEIPIAEFWTEEPFCPGDPAGLIPTRECGSNYGPALDLVGPAKTILSTAYLGYSTNDSQSCGDHNYADPDDGYGLCSGTSMSSPIVLGVAMLIRSANPLLSRDDVYYILTSTASQAGNRTDLLGFGYPDAEAAVRKALGSINGKTLQNRLTPLFSFFGTSGNPDPVANPGFQLSDTWVYTTVPSAASALLLDADNIAIVDPYRTAGPKEVPGYTTFPGVPPCTAPCDTVPRASIYVFTTRREPFPGAPELVPLYRLRYDPDILFACDPSTPLVPERDFAYATTAEEAWSLASTQGYLLDGVEGFVFKSCEGQAGCTPPAGTVRVYQAFNPSRHDHAVFPESELAAMQADGYVANIRVLGYTYPNVDTDHDTLIDGFERLLGTDPAVADTDCDGMSDGMEILRYDQTQGQYGDPLLGPCWTPDTIFANGFESGDTSRWSAVAQ